MALSITGACGFTPLTSLLLARRYAEPGAPPPTPAPASSPESAAGSCLIGNPLQSAAAVSARNGVLGHDAAVVSVPSTDRRTGLDRSTRTDRSTRAEALS